MQGAVEAVAVYGIRPGQLGRGAKHPVPIRHRITPAGKPERYATRGAFVPQVPQVAQHRVVPGSGAADNPVERSNETTLYSKVVAVHINDKHPLGCGGVE